MNLEGTVIRDIEIKQFSYDDKMFEDKTLDEKLGFATTTGSQITIDEDEKVASVEIRAHIQPTDENEKIIKEIEARIVVQVFYDITNVDKINYKNIDFVRQLAIYSYSTLRGIIFVKFQGTKLQDFILPLFENLENLDGEEDFRIIEEEEE